MAISFSRPDPSSPAAVADANFPTARRGFDQQEVREFLRTVAAELARMQDRERFLEQEVRAARQQRNAPPAELDDAAFARMLGEETARIVQAARESSTAIRNKAEEAAERMLREAKDEANAMRQDAEQDANRRRQDAEADAEAELAMAKQQGREMVDEARAYRERALGELGRRRDLARQQIDQLVHGRDRLVQAFERARLVAADVVAELVPLGELGEYVNLAPTTGPVPVMVPASRLADASAISDDALALRAGRDADDPALESATSPTPGATSTSSSPTTTTRAPVPSAPDATRAIDRLLADTPIAGADAATATSVTATVTDGDGAVGDGAVGSAGEAGTGSPADQPADESGAAVTRGATVLQFPGAPRRDFAGATGDDPTDPGSHADDAPAADVGADDAAPGDDGNDPVATDAAADADAASTPMATAEEIDDDDVTATDVDDLFAKLRTPGPPSATDPPLLDAPGEEPSAEAGSTTDGGPEPTPFDVRDAALAPLLVASARKLKRVLADEQNTVLDRLRQNDAVGDLDAIVAEAAEHGARYFDMIADDLRAAVEAGAESLGGATLDTGDDGVLAPLRDSLATELIAPLRDRLAERIDTGAGDNDAITKSARAVYREWKTKHIDDHLDDLLRFAYGRGAYEALERGEPCRWVFDPAVGPCSDCEDNSLQGDVVAGTAFPTGHVAAPAHAGCRCLLARSPK